MEIDPQEVVAFGDGENDLEMLQLCGVSLLKLSYLAFPVPVFDRNWKMQLLADADSERCYRAMHTVLTVHDGCVNRSASRWGMQATW